MAGGIEFDEVEVESFEGIEQAQATGQRRTRRRRRHGSRKGKDAAMIHGLPPGVFVLNSSDEDAAIPTYEPERNVVVWSDLLGGLATKPTGSQENAGETPHTKVPVPVPQVNSATAVWPTREQREAQWHPLWTTGPPMDCAAALPAPVQAERVLECLTNLPAPVPAERIPAFEFPGMPMQVPPQPMQLNILATSPYSTSPQCSGGFEQQAPGFPSHGWSNAHSDMMTQLLFRGAGAKVPSHAELLEQLQAVAPQSYED
eukprot:gnl/TRDRNA2_/TRDRNA2_178203_c0_seq1.p1 gnl/TRDRNA2_/TRDRNA2_178203_c0~~gnl/TRDRNA2_/TRDRNA2_178203_c0_seq1.p1  ORF type:complete len:258 (+),score=43.30 gnl/TRDRNA2_/TRDRNA2_178203_c0_seq1:109-882(+)